MAHEIRSGAWRPISALDAARRELRGEPVDWIEGAGFVVYDEQALAETQAAAASIVALLRANARAADRGPPVAWRWRPKGAHDWIYNPDPQWLAEHRDDGIEVDPLYL